MLVLSRRIGERIYIGDDICIVPLMADRGKARIGIDAPKDVVILRDDHPNDPPEHLNDRFKHMTGFGDGI